MTDAESGEPVAGALVEVAVVGDHHSELYDTTTTGEDGNYRLAGLPIGVYAWVVVAEGYQPSRASAGLFADDRSAERDFTLDVDPDGGHLGQVAGTVRDETGQVLDGASLELAAEGLADGYADGSFRPTAPVARQAVAAFLYRLDGSPEISVSTDFLDVPPGHPFHDAIAWMRAFGHASGFDDGTFRPAAPVTRQAAAAFLHRFDCWPCSL